MTWVGLIERPWEQNFPEEIFQPDLLDSWLYGSDLPTWPQESQVLVINLLMFISSGWTLNDTIPIIIREIYLMV